MAPELPSISKRSIEIPTNGTRFAPVSYITLGTASGVEKPQKFAVVWDTGSSYLLVPARGCIGYDLKKPSFDVTASRTIEFDEMKLTDCSYGTDILTSLKTCSLSVTDVVELGTARMRTEFNLTISVANREFPANGIMGIGSPFHRYKDRGMFPRILEYYEDTTIFFWTLTFDTPVDQPVEMTGEVSLGFPNFQRFVGHFAWIPVIPGPFWAFKVDSIQFGRSDTLNTSSVSYALMDTGTTQIYLPRPLFEQVLRLFPFIYTVGRTEKSYLTECTNLRLVNPFILTVAGQRLRVGNRQLFMQNMDGLCKFAFYPHDSSIIILGLMFHAPFYVAYDYDPPHVGFATAIH